MKYILVSVGSTRVGEVYFWKTCPFPCGDFLYFHLNKTYLIAIPMIAPFEGLSEAEQQNLFRLPIYVTALVAGADDNIDRAEVREAVFLAHLRVKQARPGMTDYYAVVDKDFEVELKAYIKTLPTTAEEHNPILNAELAKANDSMKKVAQKDKTFAIHFYNSMKDFARHIAEASGGLAGLLSISPEEAQSIKLAALEDPESY